MYTLQRMTGKNDSKMQGTVTVLKQHGKKRQKKTCLKQQISLQISIAAQWQGIDKILLCL